MFEKEGEEMAEAQNWVITNAKDYNLGDETAFDFAERAFLAGLEAGKDMAETDLATVAYMQGAERYKPKWHKVADGDLPKGEEYGKDSIHRDIYLKDRYGNLYTGNYFPKDMCHKEDCFAVEVLEWGFQGSQFCKKEQISEWCEIPEE